MEYNATVKCCCPAPIKQKLDEVESKHITDGKTNNELGTDEVCSTTEYTCSCETPGCPKLSDLDGLDLLQEGGKLGNLMALSKATRLKFLPSFDIILTDCDGVLWRGGRAIPGAADVINGLRQKGKQIFFLTNNSTKTRPQIVHSANQYGFQGNANEFITTAQLAAEYLVSINFDKKVYVIGSKGLENELKTHNIKCFGVGVSEINSDNVDRYVKGFNRNPDVGAVLVGFDPYLSFYKIMQASSYLTDPNVLFLATNTDERFPGDSKKIAIPGSGVMVAAVETCTGRKPDLIFGKPSDYVCKYIRSKYRFNPDRALMIGDRANTDILFGKRCGLKTLLVLSGITTLEESEKWKESTDPNEQDLVADFYVESLGDLLPLLADI